MTNSNMYTFITHIEILVDINTMSINTLTFEIKYVFRNTPFPLSKTNEYR